MPCWIDNTPTAQPASGKIRLESAVLIEDAYSRRTIAFDVPFAEAAGDTRMQHIEKDGIKR
jgi:hypothetical protein